jgi:6,7-dimethyl-8-ribityllumazine synthase
VTARPWLASRALILVTCLKEETMNQPSKTSRIAVVSSSWHRDIVQRATRSFVAELAQHQIPAGQVDEFEVPGAFEIPLQALRLAQSGRYDAIAACGLVVDGGIYRHDFVASAVIDGLMRVQLDTRVPVLSVVLTPKEFHEHEVHQKFFEEHLVHKGVEAAQACVRTLANQKALASLRT